jgi:probable rRNA maturation factor
MIEYAFQTDFQLTHPDLHSGWLKDVALSEGCEIDGLQYVFVSDDELYEMNVKYLNHNTLTDIITFDYSANRSLSGDLFISIDRVRDNAETFKASFDVELRRVMVHGLLHLAGYGDKSPEDEQLMRRKEDEKLKMFHVEQ